MNKKNLVLSTIFLAVTLTVISTVIAKTDAKNSIDDLVNRGLGVWRAHGFAIQDFQNYKWIKITFLKIPLPLLSNGGHQHPSVHEFQLGRLWLDNQTYILRNISFVPATNMTAKVFLNNTQVGFLSLQRDHSKKPNVWIGNLNFSSGNTTYHVYAHADLKKIPFNPNPNNKTADKILNETSQVED